MAKAVAREEAAMEASRTEEISRRLKRRSK
jgi:hypothetical protein